LQVLFLVYSANQDEIGFGNGVVGLWSFNASFVAAGSVCLAVWVGVLDLAQVHAMTLKCNELLDRCRWRMAGWPRDSDGKGRQKQSGHVERGAALAAALIWQRS